LIIIVPIILYIVAPRPIVKRLIGLQRKAAKLTVKSVVVGDHTIVYSEGGTGGREMGRWGDGVMGRRINREMG